MGKVFSHPLYDFLIKYTFPYIRKKVIKALLGYRTRKNLQNTLFIKQECIEIVSNKENFSYDMYDSFFHYSASYLVNF